MFKFTLTNDKTRGIMLDFLRPICPSSNSIGYNNTSWAYGVYDEENGIFITEIYCVLDGIARCDTNFYEYIVIIDDKTTFSVTYNHHYLAQDEFKISNNYEQFAEIIKDGIMLYSNGREWHTFYKRLEESGEISDFYSYCNEINKQMNKRI